MFSLVITLVLSAVIIIYLVAEIASRGQDIKELKKTVKQYEKLASGEVERYLKVEISALKAMLSKNEKAIIDLRLLNTHTMILVIEKQRRIKKLIDKYNKLFNAVNSSFLIGFDFQDVSDWLKQQNILQSDYKQEEYSEDTLQATHLKLEAYRKIQKQIDDDNGKSTSTSETKK